MSRRPGLPRQISTRATAEGSGKETRVPRWWRAKSGEWDTAPQVSADAASGGLLRVNRPRGFSGPGRSVAAPGHPAPLLPRSPAALPQPRLAEEPSRGAGGGCPHTEQGVFGSFRAGRPGHQLHLTASAERAAPVARLSLPPLPLSGRWCHWEETARNVRRRRKRSRKGGGGGGSSVCARGRVSSRRGSRVGDNFSGARAGTSGKARRERDPEGAAGARRSRGQCPAPPRPQLAASGFAAPRAAAPVYK